ncbi:hypothetical protein BDW22DRAFT_1028651 [Trametopsis cervina]|nr:hypothetical protein BDW22DRAFT_1028651 [Trametopsis cervina]
MVDSAQSTFEVFAGPLILFIAIALMLFGVFTAQCYFYWFAYESKDSKMLRYGVLSLWVFEALHTSLCLHIVYSYFIINFGDVAGGIGRVIWSAPATVMLEMAIVTISESFYIMRIYRLSGSVLVAAIPTILLVPRVALGFIVSGYLCVIDTWVEFHAHHVSQDVLNASLILAVITDVSIAGLLIFYLRHRRPQYARTKHIIQRLQRNTVNNGALTVILSIVILASLHALPNSLLFAGMIETISKVYANSVIATLNARDSIVRSGTSNVGDGFNSVELSVRQHSALQHRTDEELPEHDRKVVGISAAEDNAAGPFTA